MSKYELSIVIPAYKEAHRIGKTLDSLAVYLKTDPLIKTKSVEVIVVAADSPDKTHELVMGKSSLFTNLKLINPGPRAGKGRDVKVGMLAAKGRAVIFMDADLATPLEYIASFYELFEQGHEVVWATRDIRKHHPKLWRRLISISGNILFRILCGSWVEDSQCGFKLFSAKTAKTCFSPLTINGWGFDMEVLTIAKINNIETMYRRIDGWKSVAGGTFDDRVFKNSVIAFGELLYIAAGRITGRYKVIKA